MQGDQCFQISTYNHCSGQQLGVAWKTEVLTKWELLVPILAAILLSDDIIFISNVMISKGGDHNDVLCE